MSEIRSLLLAKEKEFIEKNKIKGRRRFVPRYCNTSKGDKGVEDKEYFNIQTKQIEIISYTKEMAIVYFCDHVLKNCKINFRDDLKHINLYTCMENMIFEDKIESDDAKVAFVVDWFFTNGSLWLDEKIDPTYRPVCLKLILKSQDFELLNQKSFSIFGK